MGLEALGPWEPLSVGEVVDLFQPATFRWWLAGGHALEAHLGRSWRGHDDIDVGISRCDAAKLPTVLAGWDIQVATDGILTPWDGKPLDDRSDLAGNNLWCRPFGRGPWALDVLLGDGDDSDWIYRRGSSIRCPWSDALLATADGTPYLAPEIQLLFKSESTRPKDDVDATTVIPALEPESRSWLSNLLPAQHPWQTIVAGERARRAIAAATELEDPVQLLASGRSSQAWLTTGGDNDSIVRVPIPNSGRVISYRSEVLVGELLADAGHPVSPWDLVPVDDVECAVGVRLDGSPVQYDSAWSPGFAAAAAAVLRDLHRLPFTGWGPLANDARHLEGTSATAAQGVIDRWFHAAIWPFDGTDLAHHPMAALMPDLLPSIASRRDDILAPAAEPYGVIHSDLHRQHLLQIDGELTGVLDFGDAFIGSTAWDFALIHWYYGAANAQRFADAYGPVSGLTARGELLALAVGCYKIAKAPTDAAALARLRRLCSTLRRPL